MAEYSEVYGINKNCITGDTDYLYHRLKGSIAKASKIDIIVAFLMESGVRLLQDDIKKAVDDGAALRILCGNYLNITHPQALYLLKDLLGDKVDLRFYNVPSKSFHPKAYLFEYEGMGEIFIGSSNISRSALTSGIEWNYRISSTNSPFDYSCFKRTFENLFLNKSIIIDDNELRRYSKGWKRPKLFDDLEKLEDKTDDIDEKKMKIADPMSEYIDDSKEQDECKIVEYPMPIGAQIEALYELKLFRQEGFDKGIVVAATGVGKTFLAAFDSKGFKRVLFVAHREEILFQAERTFKCVRPMDSTGFFSGVEKDTECAIVFATVQTIGKKEYLSDKYFKADDFDYIVIDEFHHAVSDSYRNIIEYFKPKFLLGITATPERLDSQDVFALCDYNLVYEARLKEAINKGWLVPFRYYGVFDETDYGSVAFRNGRYDEKELEEKLSINKRADLILKHYSKYNSKRALGFCSGRGHAVYMADYFLKNGISACAVISGNGLDGYNRTTCLMERKEAVKKLIHGDIQVIFSVDMFNEGLDVPEVDMVMFLRPTESPTVFLQQLGRGLRRKGSKKYLNVLDFIGNYKKAIQIPFFLIGEMKSDAAKKKGFSLPGEEDYPEGCIVDFEFRVIDLFKKMTEAQRPVRERINDEYFRIKEELGVRPLRASMYIHMDADIYQASRLNTTLNLFKDYLFFLDSLDELTQEEKSLLGTRGHAFLMEIEKTKMSKMYKMPLLLAFISKGQIKMSINEDDIYRSFNSFYSKGSNAVDMQKDTSTKDFRGWSKKEYIDLARRNPIHFLIKSSPDYFYEKDDRFSLSNDLEEFIHNPAFIEHYKDIIEYRTRRFYKERYERRKGE